MINATRERKGTIFEVILPLKQKQELLQSKGRRLEIKIN